MYTPWETHGARVVDSSNENIMERSERFYKREEDSWYVGDIHSHGYYEESYTYTIYIREIGGNKKNILLYLQRRHFTARVLHVREKV